MYLICRLLLILSACCAGLSVASFGSQFGPVGAVLAVVAVLALLGRKRARRLTAFGTARWANEQDARQAGLLSGRSGLILGHLKSDWRPSLLAGLAALVDLRLSSFVACRMFFSSISRKRSGSPPLVRLSHAVHTAVFAPTGAGKGVSCVIPFLMECRQSCVVVDFKGELARLTAGYRRRKFKHRVVLLDPFKQVTKTPDTFNPFDFIDKNAETALDECRDLAETQVIRTGQEKEPHWADVSEMWIAAMIAAVVQYGDADDRSLQTVRTLLSDPRNIEATIKLLCDSDAWGGMLARLGHQLTHFKDKELGSTLTTTNRFLRYLDTLAIAASTTRSSFNPAELLRGKMTVYLILPPEHARAQSALLRMWIGAMLRAVVRGGPQERNKVHFVLDEAASLGRLEQIDDAVDKYRGFGIRLLLMYQSLGQLKKCFPDGQDQTLLSNVSQIFFGVQDFQTAEYVSGRLGEQTIIVGSGGTSRGNSRQHQDTGPASYSSSESGNTNWQQNARKLLKPEEVIDLPERTAITFTRGVPPISTTLTRYYERRWPLLTGLKQRMGTFLASSILAVVWGVVAAAVTSAPPSPQYGQPQNRQPQYRQPDGRRPAAVRPHYSSPRRR